MKLAASLSHSAWLTSVYSAKQVLENEAIVARSQNIALYSLMEKAGKAAFSALEQHWPDARHLLILCGKGNNGGDGFIVARCAKEAGYQVQVALTCKESELKGDALLAFQAMVDSGLIPIYSPEEEFKIETIITAFCGDVIVDALFGIGFSGTLPADIKSVVSLVNQHAAPVLSIDIPSGLCATTGNVSSGDLTQQVIIAQLTITFIVYKQGLLTGQAANVIGELQLAELQLGNAFKKQISSKVCRQVRPSFSNQNKLPVLPARLKTSHKGNIGLLLAIGGNIGMPGAIRLASEAGLRSGAGLVSVCCHYDNQALVFSGRPELMLAPTTASELSNSTHLTKAKLAIIGPGLGVSTWAKAIFDFVINYSNSHHLPLVIDADALTYLASEKCKALSSCQWILTPHPKEAARLLDCRIEEIEADRYSAVRRIAQKYNAICLLKGAGSLISDGERVIINSTGNPGMASGGMGDILSGIIAALCLQHKNYLEAVCLAAYFHGLCADNIADRQGERGILASDLFNELPAIINS